MYYMAYGDNGNTEILRFGTPLANCLPVVGGSRGERRCIRRGHKYILYLYLYLYLVDSLGIR